VASPKRIVAFGWAASIGVTATPVITGLVPPIVE
jgi:hypothetical protein